jgi:hypothetical protein
LKINKIHWHDSVIKKVVELPSEERLLFEVDYPVDWEANIWQPHIIEFKNLHTYEIHEGPFSGSPTILGAEQLGTDEYGNSALKIDTNAGYRILRFNGISVTKGIIFG